MSDAVRLARELLGKTPTVGRARVWGWKGIAEAIGCAVRTARRRASARMPEEYRLPVQREPALPPARGGRVYAYVDALEEWQRRVASIVVTND